MKPVIEVKGENVTMRATLDTKGTLSRDEAQRVVDEIADDMMRTPRNLGYQMSTPLHRQQVKA